MSKTVIVLSALWLALILSQDCLAQFRRRFDQIVNRPTVSPYLNLLRQPSSLQTNTNYHTLVRPELEARRRAQQQQRSINRIQQQVSGLQQESLQRSRQQRGFITGHPTRWQNFLHYYPGLRLR